MFPGRDEGGGVESFAGRTSVWADLIPYIKDRPIQGYGYGGFWTPAIRNVIAYKEGWEVPDGHSTYVDYLLTLGVVGIILNGLCLLTGLGRAYNSFRRTRDPHFAFLAGILIFCIVDGFLESAAGEVSPLACLSIIALIRLAFVPLGQTAERATETALWKKKFDPARSLHVRAFTVNRLGPGWRNQTHEVPRQWLRHLHWWRRRRSGPRWVGCSN